MFSHLNDEVVVGIPILHNVLDVRAWTSKGCATETVIGICLKNSCEIESAPRLYRAKKGDGTEFDASDLDELLQFNELNDVQRDQRDLQC